MCIAWLHAEEVIQPFESDVLKHLKVAGHLNDWSLTPLYADKKVNVIVLFSQRKL